MLVNGGPASDSRGFWSWIAQASEWCGARRASMALEIPVYIEGYNELSRHFSIHPGCAATHRSHAVDSILVQHRGVATVTLNQPLLQPRQLAPPARTAIRLQAPALTYLRTVFMPTPSSPAMRLALPRHVVAAAHESERHDVDHSQSDQHASVAPIHQEPPLQDRPRALLSPPLRSLIRRSAGMNARQCTTLQQALGESYSYS